MECFDYIILLIILLSVYYYGMRNYSHFNGKGVQHMKPSIPFLGNVAMFLFTKDQMTESFKKIYNKFPDQKYFGLFLLRDPVIMIRDVDTIKQIANKDFDHFVNHTTTIRNDLDSLFGNMLFNLQGDKWKDMRATLTPAFTSSKIKNMFELVDECANEFMDYYAKKMNSLEDDVLEIEVKKELSKLTNDVIASVAFGLKVNSSADENNDFYRHSKGVTMFEGIQKIRLAGCMLLPSLMKLLKIEFLDRKISAFFKAVVTDTMKHRSEHNIVRNDMIKLLMEAKKNQSKEWTEDELTAQALSFFFAGFDTILNFLGFFFYEMVKNPDIQTNLQREIDEFSAKTDAQFAYDDLHKLKYLEMCISETLRVWPAAAGVDRVCNKPYNLPPPSDSSDQSYQISVGQAVLIPIYAIHHNPEYFPNPDRFDPERFSEENRVNMNLSAFMPFGIGPRNCIGSRFALMELKIIIYRMLSKFEFVASSKTEFPVALDITTMNIMPKNGMHLGIKLR